MQYAFSDYTLDTQRYELRRTGALVPLRPKVFHLLAYLLAHRDRVISRQELCEHLWPKQFVSDATLDACLAQVRQAVGDSGRAQHVIQTRHGYGYRFAAAVKVHDDPLRDGDKVSTFASAHESAQVEPAESRAEMARFAYAIAGERKVVTALVCTLANAAGLAQRLEAETLHCGMQAFFALVLKEVKRYGGTLQRVSDDGVLALFGAPLAHEEHAQRAVLTALALQQQLATSHPEQAFPLGETWAACIGLHTGQVIVGNLGEHGGLTFTSAGDTTHLAAWLAERAAPGTILVSEATAQLVRGAVRLGADLPLPGPGESHAGRTYQVLGLVPHRAPLLGDTTRPLSAFVGRQLELATLQALLRRVEGGQGQVVSLVGEPGMGKTRLVFEFWRRLANTRVTSLEGRSDSYGQATPYLPLQEIVRQACGIAEVELPAAITAQVHQHLEALGLVATEEAPYLLHLLGVPDATARLAGLNPQTIRMRTFGALHQLLLRQSQRQPVLMVVENLHWSDPTSQEYLTEFVERLAGMPLLLLVTCRPGYRPAWMDKSYATQLTLPQLDPEDSWCVVQAVLPIRPLPEHLLEDILAKAGGNPLFLEELAWAIREQGGRQLPPEVPATVQAVLAARIDGLPPEAKQLLQTAAVIGREVPWPLLQAVAEMSEDELQRALRQLQANEFLYETCLIPEGSYVFKHALTHEVAYDSLLQARRRVLHARIVEALEARVPEQVERLAYHVLRGEMWDKAVTYCQQAGARALDRAAFHEAVASFEQALHALAHLPDQSDTRGLALDLRLALGGALTQLGEHERCLALLGEAEALARALDDRVRLGRLLSMMALVLRTTGDHSGAIAVGRQAFDLAAELGDSAMQLQASLNLAQAYDASGYFGRAAELLRRNVEAADRETGPPSTELRIRCRAWLTRTLSALGAFAEGRRHGEEALRLATMEGRGSAPISVHGCLGRLYLAQGDLEHAIQVLEQGLTLCRASGNRIWFPMIAASLGYAAALQGRLAEGHALLEEAIREAIRAGSGHAYRVAWLSEVCRLAGRSEEVWQHAHQALDLARRQQAHGDEAFALHQLGIVHAHSNPPDVAQAETHYQQALALAESRSMRPLVAHCHLGLGKLYRKVRRHDEASVELSTAIDLYRAMEMTFWLPQAEAALAEAVRSELTGKEDA